MAEFQGTSRFQVLRRLGAGGMGVVYEALDRERQQRVALKVLPHADPDTLYRFKREFRSLVGVVHPNLISLYELVGEADAGRTGDPGAGPTERQAGGVAQPRQAPRQSNEQWFFTMELLEGGVDFLRYVGRIRPQVNSPASWEDTPTATAGMLEAPTLAAPPESGADPGVRPPVAPPEAPALDAAALQRLRRGLVQMAEGVGALHRAGKLHRDLKPANVMVRPDGQLLLLDFGLVLEHDEARDGARSGATPDGRTEPESYWGSTVAGTIPYMSPEQAAGGLLTPASDWYAVGVMLFEALTGRHPYQGTAREVLERKQRWDAPAPAEVVGGIPDDLNALCQALLQREASQRADGEAIGHCCGATAVAAAAGQTSSETTVLSGREEQLTALADAYADASAGQTVIAHLHGASGLGKSSILDEFLRRLSARAPRPLLLRGRCYEQESVPYKAMDSVMDALTNYLRLLPGGDLAPLLPENLSALVRVFPVLERAVTLSAGVVQTADVAALRRQAFAALRHMLTRLGQRVPLVMVIDDLQWGDIDSAALLEELVRPPDAPPLLLLVSYRDEYAARSACLRALRALDAAPAGGLRSVRIPVLPLTPPQARALALQLLGGRTDQEVAAERMARESGGNPYFIQELAQHAESSAAELDAMLWNRVQRLPEEARRLLEVIAVSGQPLPLRLAQQAGGLEALEPHLILGLRSERLVRSTGPTLDDEFEAYHDRIRESVLANLGAAVQQEHHRGLAETLEASGGAAPQTLAVHFAGAGLHPQASRYYVQAADQAQHALAFERAEAFYKSALALAPANERLGIQERQIHFYTDLARFGEAYATGREAIQSLGVRLPKRFLPPAFAMDFVEAKLRLRGRDIASIAGLPPMQKERLTAAVRIMADVGKAAYQIRPELCIAVMAKIVNRCLRHGNTPDCAIGYMAYGAIFLGGVLGNHRAGYEFGRMALALIEKYGNQRQRPEVNFVVGYFGTSWLRPATEAEALWRTARAAGLETGDLFHTGCACCATALSRFMRGDSLPELWNDSEADVGLLQRFGLRDPLGAILSVRQAMASLREGTAFADVPERELAGYGSRHMAHYYFILKMQVHYLRGEYAAAAAAAERSAGYLRDSTGMLHVAEHCFYDGLIAARQPRGQSKLRAASRKFEKWAQVCPHNFAHKAALLRAEQRRRAGDAAGALRNYAAAAEAAQRYGYRNIEALAAQLAAQLDTSHGWAKRATACYRAWGANAYAERWEETAP